MGWFETQQNADKITQLVISGHSCSDCRNYNCPYEGGYSKPIVGGVNICHKWSG